MPAVIVAVEVVAALIARPRPVSAGPRVPAAVLIPAHNEEAVLEETLRSLLEQTIPQDRLLVVADNCTDRTAEIARTLGVEVVERQHETQRGKGYALAFGTQHLEASPPEVLVVVDADCRLGPGCLDRLVRRCQELGRSIQSDYQLVPAEASPRTAVSALAILVRNKVRPLGLRELGLGCQLTGSGMAFPWAQWSSVSGLDDFLAEDLLLGVRLTQSGHAPMFEDEAEVRSVLPVQTQSQARQRNRWEQGQLTMLLRYGPRLLWDGLRNLDRVQFAAGLDLMVPPLAAWLLAAMAWFAFTLVLGWLIGDLGPASWTALSIAVMGGAAFLAWARFGRERIRAQDLIAIPAYILWKVPLYAKMLVARTTGWEKTKRDA